tara:strand:- start:2278 stop:2703 length:426 start_codon:yes stop_codon:yes gene_type:complete
MFASCFFSCITPSTALPITTALTTTNRKYARVVSVYDGDTITIVMRLHLRHYQFKCRLVGIDTPELRTRNEKEKQMGYQAKQYLVELIDKQLIQVQCQGLDKYGRLLILPYIHGDNVCELMIQKGWAQRYDGGTKTPWVFD